MRKIFYILFAVLLFSGCSKEKIENLPMSNLSATLNNGSWSAFTVDTHIIYIREIGYSINEFEIRATTKDKQELYFNIYSTSSGIYDAIGNCYISYQPDVDNFGSMTYTATKGEVNLSVDTVNYQISGTFDIVLKKFQDSSDSVVVKNGLFHDLKYTVRY